MLWKLFGYDNREAPCVRYDGIYVYRRGPVTSGLRFYNDRLVCAASSPTADEIMGLILCRENIEKARGCLPANIVFMIARYRFSRHPDMAR